MDATRVPISLRARRIGRRFPPVRAIRILVSVACHPSNRQGRLSAICRAVNWQVRSRLSADRVEVAAYGDTVVLCYPRSNSASNVIYFTPYYDYDEMHFLDRYLRAGDVMVDAGANIGTYSILAATRVGPSGQVIAFEPAPVAFGRLRENVVRNALEQVELHGVAVGARTDRAAMRISSDVSNTLVTVPGLVGVTTGVDVVRLDDVVGERRPALIKLDVEGYELEALQGAEGLLAVDPPPVMLIEFTDHLLRAGGTSLQAFRAWLRDRRYELYDYDAQTGELRAVGSLLSGNHLAIRDDGRGHVLARLSSTTPGDFRRRRPHRP